MQLVNVQDKGVLIFMSAPFFARMNDPRVLYLPH